MKRVFININKVAMLLMLMALAMAAQPAWAQHQFGERRKSYGYGVDRNAVYFEGRVIPGADARTFEYMAHGYARDRRAVYYRGEVLQGANPRTFRVVGDAEEQPPVVIPDGRGGGIDPRDGADWGRFPEELLPGNSLGFGYSKTNFDVYYLGKKIDASASSFQVLSFGYAKDAFNIYFEGAEVKDASSGTFRVLIDGYAKDAFNAYYRGREIPDCNVRTFECMGKGVARDDENKYFLGQKVVW